MQGCNYHYYPLPAYHSAATSISFVVQQTQQYPLLDERYELYVE